MKIFLRSSWNFSKEALDFYRQHFELVEPDEAEIIVINDFEKIKTDKIVAANMTGVNHIKAKKIIKLEGKELKTFTAVPELTFSLLVYLLRIFKQEEAKGKTIGIIGGSGRIGEQLTKIAEFMGLKVLSYDTRDNFIKKG
jgi:phosphoglycerate dehydrogenase-like enzyme